MVFDPSIPSAKIQEQIDKVYPALRDLKGQADA